MSRLVAALRCGALCVAVCAGADAGVVPANQPSSESPSEPADAVCPRPAAGSVVEAPTELRSRDGVLEATLTLRTVFTRTREQRFCYIATVDGRDVESPTLRVAPGDLLVIHFRNELTTDVHPQSAFPRAAAAQAATRAQSMTGSQPMSAAMPMPAQPGSADGADAACTRDRMSARGSNQHFHGLAVPPVCHVDEVLRTLVLSGESFDYRVRIPADEPPGTYWYHPHPHGYAESQVLGGASGVLIVEGARRGPRTLAERTLVFRDSLVTEAVQRANERDSQQPAWNVSVNFVPVLYPANTPARLVVAAAREERWRLVNASADLALALEYVVAGMAQPLRVEATDGRELPAPTSSRQLKLMPGARADVIVPTPPAGVAAALRTARVDTGPDGESEPARPLAEIVARPAHNDMAVVNGVPVVEARRVSRMADAVPYLRTLYFSEHATSASREGYTQFFLTVAGAVPRQYAMGQPPDITVHRGAVERWTIENRAREMHVFHLHQLHFRVVARDGAPVDEPAMLDTVEVPYWRGVAGDAEAKYSGDPRHPGAAKYPSVTVEIAFDGPAATGVIPYHCHILAHEDAGMMGTVEVLPPGATATLAPMPGRTIGVAVSGSIGGVQPGGMVQFQQAGRVVGEAPIVDGRAVLQSASAMMSAPVTAVYAGDRYFSGSSIVVGAAGAH